MAWTTKDKEEEDEFGFGVGIVNKEEEEEEEEEGNVQEWRNESEEVNIVNCNRFPTLHRFPYLSIYLSIDLMIPYPSTFSFG